MRIAVLSDIHGNLQALEAVLEALAPRGIDRYLVAGDVVGYGADPVACVERVRSLGATVVAGNHDRAVTGQLDLATFSHDAAQAARWTARRLGESERSFLSCLPLVYDDEDLLMVHSSPLNPEDWPYLADLSEVRRALAACQRRICFVGHSHVPFVYGRGEGEAFGRREGRYDLEPSWRYLVNTGSVGQPRDGDPRACCVIVDLGESWLELVRVRYPVEIAQARIRGEEGLPEFLAWRLRWGI